MATEITELIQIPPNKKVIIEITYNGRGYCQWKKNKIIQLV